MYKSFTPKMCRLVAVDQSWSGAAAIRDEFDLLKGQVRGQSVEITQKKNKVERQGAQLIWASKQIETLMQQQDQQLNGDNGRIRKRSPPSMQIKNTNKLNIYSLEQ